MEILLKFVSGEISVQEFENELYTNNDLELLLRKSTDWNGTFVGKQATNLFDYLIAINYSSSNDTMNAIGALQLYFQKEGVAYPKKNKYSEIHNLMLESQPKYIDANILFIEQYILPTDNSLTKAELKKIMLFNFKQHFRFQNKPPHWIQNPAWLIKNDKPLFFIGQLELKNELIHDNGMVYVFLNEETGEIETVNQFH